VVFREAYPGRASLGGLPVMSELQREARNRHVELVPQGRPLYRDTAELRRLVHEGKVAVFAEIAPQYRGRIRFDRL